MLFRSREQYQFSRAHGQPLCRFFFSVVLCSIPCGRSMYVFAPIHLFHSTMRLPSFFGASERDSGIGYYSTEETGDLMDRLPSHDKPSHLALWLYIVVVGIVACLLSKVYHEKKQQLFVPPSMVPHPTLGVLQPLRPPIISLARPLSRMVKPTMRATTMEDVDGMLSQVWRCLVPLMCWKLR